MLTREELQKHVDYVNQSYGYGLETRLLDRSDFHSEEAFSSYRCEFWHRVIPGYDVMGKSEARKVKLEMIKFMKSWSDLAVFPSEQAIPCKKACPPAPKVQIHSLVDLVDERFAMVDNSVARKEQEMRTEADVKRDYLYGRLSMIEEKQYVDARRRFGLLDDEYPDKVEDLIKRIQDGKFVIRKGYENARVYAWEEAIRFRDPAKAEDQAGYDLVEQQIDKDARDVRDTVTIADPVEGLAAVKAFEAKTYH